MTPRNFIIAVAGAFCILAGILLLTPVSATTPGGQSVSCGSVSKPDTSQADSAHLGEGISNIITGRTWASNSYEGFQKACADARESRGTWSAILGVLGLLGFIGGVAVRRSAAAERQTGQESPPAA